MTIMTNNSMTAVFATNHKQLETMSMTITTTNNDKVNNNNDVNNNNNKKQDNNNNI